MFYTSRRSVRQDFVIQIWTERKTFLMDVVSSERFRKSLFLLLLISTDFLILKVIEEVCEFDNLLNI